MNTDTNRALDMGTRAGQALHALWLAAENPDPAALELARDKALDVLEDMENHHIHRIQDLLPAWFVERMNRAVGPFGLMLSTGAMLAIDTVLDVTQAADGSLWLDVRLAAKRSTPEAVNAGWLPAQYAPTTRNTCSVALAHVVCAVELADT